MKNSNYLDTQEILNTVQQYAWAFDTNDMKLMESVFSEDGTTSGMISETDMGWGPWKGAAFIAEQLGTIRSSQTDIRRHVLTTPVFTSITDDQAEIKCNLCLYASENNQASVLVTTGEYLAKLSKQSGQWKLDSLDAVLDSGF